MRFLFCIVLLMWMSSGLVGQTFNPNKINSEENKVFPVPANDFLYFESNSNIDLVHLYSLEGKIINRFSTNGTQGMVPVSYIPEGIYYFIALNGNGEVVIHQKVIIN